MAMRIMMWFFRFMALPFGFMPEPYGKHAKSRRRLQISLHIVDHAAVIGFQAIFLQQATVRSLIWLAGIITRRDIKNIRELRSHAKMFKDAFSMTAVSVRENDFA